MSPELTIDAASLTADGSNYSIDLDNCCTTGTYTTGTSTTTGTYTYPTYPTITGTYPTTVTMSPTNITWTVDQGVEKEYVEKLEKHIDELEEDIEYFNGQLQEKDTMIHDLLDKKDELEKDMSDMNCHIIYLEGRLKALEDKINK